ncbi:MAG: histidine phosphatase family protein [Acidobacteriota bacterium]
MTRIVFIRHGEVHPRWRGHCYGDADLGLGSRGRAQSRHAANAIALWIRDQADDVPLLSSDLRRTRYLAGLLEKITGLRATLDPALRERNFGAWEKKSWDAIYAETGDAMDGMIAEPATWSPPGGETTFAMRDRVLRALDGHLRHRPAAAVVVGHGGPIAAVRGTAAGAPVPQWPDLVPGHGEWLPHEWSPQTER